MRCLMKALPALLAICVGALVRKEASTAGLGASELGESLGSDHVVELLEAIRERDDS